MGLRETDMHEVAQQAQIPGIRRSSNQLFPVFLKLEKLNLLLVGGGNVAMEKLGAILGNSPGANIKLVAGEINPAVMEVLSSRGIPFEKRFFIPADLEGVDLAVIAINDRNASAAIQQACRNKRVLTNVADTPEHCDFYLSSVVQKGNLKIAISTNGKSPTIAKRVKEVLNEVFPEEMEDVLGNMEKIRNTLSGDFAEKVRQLNDITRTLSLQNGTEKSVKRKVSGIFLYTAAAIFFMVAGYFLFSFLLTVI